VTNRLLIAAIVAALVAALGTLGAWWFFDNFEQREEERVTPPRGAARANPYLAAERFAMTMGATATSAKTLTDLDVLPAKGVLILPRNRAAVGELHVERILKWVAAGGFLLTEPDYSEGSDPLMDALDIEQSPASRKVLSSTTIKLPWTDDREFTVNLRGRSTIERTDPPADSPTLLELADERGTRVLGFAHGEGKVVVFARLTLIENADIGKESHAEIFWQLLRWHNADSLPKIVFFNQPTQLSAWQWLIDHAPFVIIAGAAFIALWLWRIAVRFGPIAPDPPPTRRRLTDHLVASGRFLWRRKTAGDALVSARELALRRMERITPGFSSADPRDQMNRLQEHLGFSAEESRAVVAGGAENSHDFLALVRSLHRIHSTTRTRLRTNN
jgi:hypothetical protein